MSGSNEADPCSNSDRSSRRVWFNRIDQWSTASGLTDCDLNVHGLKGYGCDRCPKTDVQNAAKETVQGTHLHCHLHCHTDCKSSVSLERLVNALKNVHPALKACYLVTHERYVLIVPL